MVLFDKAMMELSSLVASVTLLPLSVKRPRVLSVEYIHQRVWLLLLLQDGSGCLVDLVRINKVLSEALEGWRGKHTSFFSAPDGSLM